jgi:hypothetical protein
VGLPDADDDVVESFEFFFFGGCEMGPMSSMERYTGFNVGLEGRFSGEEASFVVDEDVDADEVRVADVLAEVLVDVVVAADGIGE